MSLLLFILFPLMTGMSSCKKDKTLDIDITKFSWTLKEVRTIDKTLKPEKKEYFREEAFILKFDTDTTFILNTSVNFAGGKYLITQKGKITIVVYGESTQVGAVDINEKELNENLLTVFSYVDEYKVAGKTLTFKGEKGEVEFKRE